MAPMSLLLALQRKTLTYPLLVLALGLGYITSAVTSEAQVAPAPPKLDEPTSAGLRFPGQAWNEGGGTFDLRHYFERQDRLQKQPDGVPERAKLISLQVWRKRLEQDRELGPAPWHNSRFRAYGDLSYFGWRRPGRDTMVPAGIVDSLRYHGLEDCTPELRSSLELLEKKAKQKRGLAFQAVLQCGETATPVSDLSAYLVEKNSLFVLESRVLAEKHESIGRRERALQEMVARKLREIVKE